MRNGAMWLRKAALQGVWLLEGRVCPLLLRSPPSFPGWFPSKKVFLTATRCSHTSVIQRYGSGVPYVVDIGENRNSSLPVNQFTLPKESISKHPQWNDVPILYTTGVLMNRNDEKFPASKARIAVYWGENSPDNCCQDIDCCSPMAAELEAICLALKQGIFEKHLRRIVIRTTSKDLLDILADDFITWARNDFVTFKGEKVENSDVFEELQRLLTFSEIRFEYFPCDPTVEKNVILGAVEGRLVDGKGFGVARHSSVKDKPKLRIDAHFAKKNSILTQGCTSAEFSSMSSSTASSNKRGHMERESISPSPSGSVGGNCSVQNDTQRSDILSLRNDHYRHSSKVSEDTAVSHPVSTAKSRKPRKEYDKSRRYVVHTSGTLHTVFTEGRNISVGGYGVFWPDFPERCAHGRFSMFPITLFRSQLNAVIIALETAISMGLEDVIVRTDSPSFVWFFSTKWLKRDGSLLSNHSLYKRILKLSLQIKSVVFEAEDQRENSKALMLAEIGLKDKYVPKGDYYWTGLPDTETAHNVSDSKADVEATVPANEQRMSLVRNKKDGELFYVISWQGKGGGSEGEESTEGRADLAVVQLLEHAAKKTEKGRPLVIELDSMGLLRTLTIYLPRWERRGWLNTVGRPIANAEQWKHAFELLNGLQVKWVLKRPQVKVLKRPQEEE